MATVSWAQVDAPSGAIAWTIEFQSPGATDAGVNDQVVATRTGSLDSVLALNVPVGTQGHFVGRAFNDFDAQVIRRPAKGEIPIDGDSGPHTFFFELGSLAGGDGGAPQPGGPGPTPNGATGMSNTVLILGGVALVGVVGLAIFMSRK